MSNTLSTHPINTPSQHILSTHPINTPYQHILLLGTDLTEVHPDILYPDTDLQYSHGTGMQLAGGGGDGGAAAGDGSSGLIDNGNGAHSGASSSAAQGLFTHPFISY